MGVEEVRLRRRSDADRLKYVLQQIADYPVPTINDPETIKFAMRTLQTMARGALET